MVSCTTLQRKNTLWRRVYRSITRQRRKGHHGFLRNISAVLAGRTNTPRWRYRAERVEQVAWRICAGRNEHPGGVVDGQKRPRPHYRHGGAAGGGDPRPYRRQRATCPRIARSLRTKTETSPSVTKKGLPTYIVRQPL